MIASEVAALHAEIGVVPCSKGQWEVCGSAVNHLCYPVNNCYPYKTLNLRELWTSIRFFNEEIKILEGLG